MAAAAATSSGGRSCRDDAGLYAAATSTQQQNVTSRILVTATVRVEQSQRQGRSVALWIRRECGSLERTGGHGKLLGPGSVSPLRPAVTEIFRHHNHAKQVLTAFVLTLLSLNFADFLCVDLSPGIDH